MTKRLNPATPEQRDVLADPKVLRALAVLSSNKWLSLSTPQLREFFGDERHPAKDALEAEARSGGPLGVIQLAITVAILALVLFVTSFQGLSNPVVFFMWAALGLTVGLLVSRYPAHLDNLRQKKS